MQPLPTRHDLYERGDVGPQDRPGPRSPGMILVANANWGYAARPNLRRARWLVRCRSSGVLVQ
jgi:hypothetical protein